MKIVFTGHGLIAEAYWKINPDAVCYSFRKLNDNEIASILSNADVIVHNAANIYTDDLNTAMRDNLVLTQRIIYLVKKYRPDIRFIYIGSMSYLTKDGYLSLASMEPYTKSKFLSEMYCIATLSNLKVVRFSTIFYKNKDRDGLSKLCAEALYKRELYLLNAGSARRDFIPINIAVQYLDYVINNKTDQIVNICTGIETSFLQAAKMISKYVIYKLGFKLSQQKEVLSKFERVLPEIKFSLEDEIKDYINQLKKE